MKRLRMPGGTRASTTRLEFGSSGSSVKTRDRSMCGEPDRRYSLINRICEVSVTLISGFPLCSVMVPETHIRLPSRLSGT